MMIKAALFLLVALGVLGIFGGFRLRRRDPRRRISQSTCARCGRPRIGKGPCDCTPPEPRG
ncbi:hypothetical protein SAMN05421774_105309 [Gemmobacter megaterium]|uniref:Uncharacterized protein n=1 Tax=Gemmobacter megaterium TaxID=1086013 RepID=A0A1N7PJD5_9RHOB|nr:hypothetical protein [Gemmobacter megaterium]SIT10735.1 hypothetical protein SAMN05421774_105309 [Gemmobacter megaterium]